MYYDKHKRLISDLYYPRVDPKIWIGTVITNKNVIYSLLEETFVIVIELYSMVFQF